MASLDTSLDNGLAGWRGGGFLSRYYDPGLEPPSDLSSAVITADEIARLSRNLSIIIYATSIPRRLGGDASREELALDKKRGRRTAHALQQALRGWGGKATTLKMDDELRREGAQLDWLRWKETHLAHLNTRLSLIATWSILENQQEFGKHAIVRFQNEVNWVTYALRD